MSFTEDELQAFNTILEQRLAAHSQEMQQALDQRIDGLRQHIDQRMTTAYQELIDTLEPKLIERASASQASVIDRLGVYQEQIVGSIHQQVERAQQDTQAANEHLLSEQLAKIEQLFSSHMNEHSTFAQDVRPQLETIELQTELPWEDLAEVVGRTMDTRLVSLNDQLQGSIKSLEQHLAVRLHNLHNEVTRGYGQSYNNISLNATSVQEILRGIEQLEQIIESMQVAMTANHALLSNRLYHHQQLPLDRAHAPATGLAQTGVNGTSSLLAQAKERVARGLEAGSLDETSQD